MGFSVAITAATLGGVAAAANHNSRHSLATNHNLHHSFSNETFLFFFVSIIVIILIFCLICDGVSRSDEYIRYQYKKKVKKEKELEDKVRKDRILLMKQYSKMSSVEPWKIKYRGKG